MTEETIASGANLESRWDELLFHVDRSIRYNDRRSSFWGWLDRMTNAINLIFSSGVLLALLKNNTDMSAMSAALVTVMTATSLVWGFGRMEMRHHSLASRYRDIEADMRSSEPSEDELRLAIRARLAAEKDEPPAKMVLNDMCHNETVIALGRSEAYLVEIPLIKRMFAHWI